MPGGSGVNIRGARSDDFIWISSVSQQKLIRTCNFREELHVILVQEQDDSGGRLQGVADARNRTPSQRRPLSSSLILTGRRQTTGFLFNYSFVAR